MGRTLFAHVVEYHDNEAADHQQQAVIECHPGEVEGPPPRLLHGIRNRLLSKECNQIQNEQIENFMAHEKQDGDTENYQPCQRQGIIIFLPPFEVFRNQVKSNSPENKEQVSDDMPD